MRKNGIYVGDFGSMGLAPKGLMLGGVVLRTEVLALCAAHSVCSELSLNKQHQATFSVESSFILPHY